MEEDCWMNRKREAFTKSASGSNAEVGFIIEVSKPMLFFNYSSSPQEQHQPTLSPNLYNQWVTAEIDYSAENPLNSNCFHDGYDECHLIVTYETHQQRHGIHGQPSETQKHSEQQCLFKISTNLFNGMISGMSCGKNDSSVEHRNGLLNETSTDCKKKRSDMSLLLGAALESQRLGHIKIESLRVMLHKDTNEVKSDGVRLAQLVDGTVLLTLSIPNIENGGPFAFSRGAGSAQYSRREIPCVTQLIFSLVETEWDRLEEYLPVLQLHSTQLSQNSEQQENKEESAKLKSTPKFPTRSTLFPGTLSLQNLFNSIQDMHDGLSVIKPSGVNSVSLETLPLTADSKALFQALPRDVLTRHLAPYLRAKSLYALRCSCKLFYTLLHNSIPGMKLKLYRHQCRSLNWMHIRESQLLPVCSKEEVYFLDRKATASVDVVLSTRNKPRTYFHVNSVTGCISIIKNSNHEKRQTAPNVTRGGLLCDDAGLGKTITVLSLILLTLGQSTHSADQMQQNSPEEKLIFYRCWNTLNQEEKKQEFISLHNQMRKQDKYGCFDHIFSVEWYMDIVSQPICMADIRKKITGHEYETGNNDSFQNFCRDFKLMFRNARSFHAKDSPVYYESNRLHRFFKYIVRDFHSKCIHMVQRRCKEDLQKDIQSIYDKEKIEALTPTAATLLVVPKPLLNHWHDQMMLHIDFSYISFKTPLVFHHRPTTGDSIGSLDSKFCYHTSSMIDAVQLLEGESTHFGALFIDHDPTMALPPHNFISKFFVVLTTNQRLSNAWKSGRVEKECTPSHARSQNMNPSAGSIVKTVKSSICPFLKVRWLRLVVDEGHTMGKGYCNNAVQFSSWIYAQRRWAMTGTPTPQTNRNSDLRNILGLMKFLQHSSFSSDDLWKKSISKSWNEGSCAGYFRLCHLLSFLMRRHTKDSIQDIPPPCFKSTLTELSQSETLAYNTLAGVVQSNILITAMECKGVSAWEDSLLNPKHASHASQALQNVRLSCCGGTNLLPTLSEKSFNETVDLLLNKHNVELIKVEIVKRFLRTATNGGVTSCRLCGIQLQQLLILPCGDLLCSQCMVPDDNVCPVCNKDFDADKFQELQPGFNVTWQWNIGGKNGYSETPSSLQGNYHLPFRRRKYREPHVCRYSKLNPIGVCLICREEHSFCDMANENLECSTCYRKAEECPEEETKSSYIISRLLELIKLQKNNSISIVRSAGASRFVGENVKSNQPRALKVIIFSQFRKILNVVGDRLLRRLGCGVVAEFWGCYRDEELRKFKTSSQCVCMLLGRDGAHGLDLSFVTNIIFLDEIYDKSVKHQVVSRAYRMGAEGSVEVEQLIAKNSIEEVMATMSESHEEECAVSAASSHDLKRNGKNGQSFSKLHFLLTNLRLIHPNAEKKTRTKKRPLAVDEGEGLGDANKSKQSRVRFCV